MSRAQWLLRLRTAASVTATVLSLLALWAALVAPDRISPFTVTAYLRIPLEGVALIGVAIFLPRWPRRVLAVTAGALLGVLAVLRLLNTGFYLALDRNFNPVTDWSYSGPAIGVLRDSVGRTWARIAVIGIVLLFLAVFTVMCLATLRVTRVGAQHRTIALRTVTALGSVWLLCFVLGLQTGKGLPAASTTTARLAYAEAHQVQTGIADQRQFAKSLAAKDPAADTTGQDLLSGLHGRDVLVVFIESYGRVAVQDSSFSPAVDSVLAAGTHTLQQAGFSAESAFLTSPTFGGISWLAHSTLQSGLWVNNQLRYNALVRSDRFTLSDAFERAGWRTVADVPSNEIAWPEGRTFYHYAQIYDDHNVGYQGPRFSYASMPDEYVLSAFERLELNRSDRTPVMAEIDLVSSHTPWAPLPRIVPWSTVGDGRIFDPMPAQGQSPATVWRDPNQVRAAYGQSIEYTLNALFDFVSNAHDPNLVLVALGDHQPATIVSGTNPGHDVPISIISHDPAVLSRIASWGWQTGMLPNPNAPVWRMDAFRNRFLATFGGAGPP